MKNISLTLVLIMFSGSTYAGLSVQAGCKANGYKFSNVIWDSGFSSKVKANQQANVLKTFKQPTTSATNSPMKSCCSQTARPKPFVTKCPTPGSLGQKPMDPVAKSLCQHPNVSWIVAYNWVCEAKRKGMRRHRKLRR